MILWTHHYAFQRFSHMAESFQRSLQNLLENPAKAEFPLDVVLKEHKKNRKESPFYRFCDRPWILPVTSFLGQCQNLSNSLSKEGIAKGCRNFLDTLGIQLRVFMEPKSRDILSRHLPVLLVGEHPSSFGFDFFAVAASLADISFPEDNLFFLGWLLVQGIIPGFRQWMFPITVTHEEFGFRPQPNNRFGFFTDWVQTCALKISRYASARFNAKSLDRLCRSWIDGNRIVIFPDGGPTTLPHWRSGLGHMLIQAAKTVKQDALEKFYILFFRTEGANDRLLLNPPIFSRYHLVRLLLKPKRQSIVVYYGSPFPFADIQKMMSRMKSKSVSEMLHKEYQKQIGNQRMETSL